GLRGRMADEERGVHTPRAHRARAGGGRPGGASTSTSINPTRRSSARSCAAHQHDERADISRRAARPGCAPRFALRAVTGTEVTEATVSHRGTDQQRNATRNTRKTRKKRNLNDPDVGVFRAAFVSFVMLQMH